MALSRFHHLKNPFIFGLSPILVVSSVTEYQRELLFRILFFLFIDAEFSHQTIEALSLHLGMLGSLKNIPSFLT